MATSINTNYGAAVALQNLNATNAMLERTQNRVSTGLKVGSAKDNGAIWAIAQGQSQQVAALAAVTSSLNRASSIADVASGAGQTISDLLNHLKQTVLSATDPSLTANSRASLNTDYHALLSQITGVIQSASFDGANLLDGSQASFQFITNGDATQFLTLQGQNLSLGGPLLTLSATSSINTATNASSVLSQLNTSITQVNDALSQLGSQASQIGNHLSFVSQLSGSLNTGIGDLVDADMASESARLQALQVQQQLSIQAIGVANSTPQTILSLFRGSGG